MNIWAYFHQNNSPPTFTLMKLNCFDWKILIYVITAFSVNQRWCNENWIFRKFLKVNKVAESLYENQQVKNYLEIFWK